MNQILLHTDGSSLWSNAARAVRITDLKINYVDDDFIDNGADHPNFGELCVYFDTKTWSVPYDGLIYTDRLFERELREFLTGQSLAGNDVYYSEQGMQGNDYVSCDVGGEFLKSWGEKFNIGWKELVLERGMFFG